MRSYTFLCDSAVFSEEPLCVCVCGAEMEDMPQYMMWQASEEALQNCNGSTWRAALLCECRADVCVCALTGWVVDL